MILLINNYQAITVIMIYRTLACLRCNMLEYYKVFNLNSKINRTTILPIKSIVIVNLQEYKLVMIF